VYNKTVLCEIYKTYIRSVCSYTCVCVYARACTRAIHISFLSLLHALNPLFKMLAWIVITPALDWSCVQNIIAICFASDVPVTLNIFNLQGAAFNVTHFESRTTHLLYTAINTTEHGQVSQCLGFTKSLTSLIQRLGDVLHDNQGNAAISQVHLPWRDVECPA